MGNETDFKFRIALLRGGMGKNTKIGKQVRFRVFIIVTHLQLPFV